MNGYAQKHPVGIEVRADVLEIAAGWPDEDRADRELSFALAAVDDSPETLRWLAVCIATKLDFLAERGVR